MLALAFGALATLRASLQVSIMGIMTAITTKTIVISTKANPTGTTTAPTARRSTCICEQMPVSELAVMVQAAVNFKAHGEREKTHGGDHGKDSSDGKSLRRVAPFFLKNGS